MSDEIEISPFGNNLVYKSGYTPAFVATTLENLTLNGLKVNTRWANLKNLDFLEDFRFLEALEITGPGDFDNSFLLFLTELKRLSLSIDGTHVVDLRNQVHLEDLTIRWRKGKITGLDRCQKIASLCLVDFDESNFAPISSLMNVVDLRVKTASVKSLEGLEPLSKLKSLLLGNCKHLARIDSLEGLTKLSSLGFESCPKVHDYESVGNLTNLEELQIIDCKGVRTIQFLKRLPVLRKLSLLGNTDVLDGDLKPATSIKEVVYKPRQHYNFEIVNDDYHDLIKSNRAKLTSIVNPEEDS